MILISNVLGEKSLAISSCLITEINLDSKSEHCSRNWIKTSWMSLFCPTRSNYLRICFPKSKAFAKSSQPVLTWGAPLSWRFVFFRFFFFKFNYAIYLSSPQGHLHCSFPAEVELRSPHLSDTEASISNYLRAGSISVLVSVGSRSLVLLHASSPNRHRTWTWSSSINEQRKTY